MGFGERRPLISTLSSISPSSYPQMSSLGALMSQLPVLGWKVLQPEFECKFHHLLAE